MSNLYANLTEANYVDRRVSSMRMSDTRIAFNSTIHSIAFIRFQKKGSDVK